VQAVHHPCAVLKLALGLIRRSLCDMDVEPGVEACGSIGATGDGLIAHGKGGMQPKETSEQAVSGLPAVL
jgi:hypothetical protein